MEIVQVVLVLLLLVMFSGVISRVLPLTVPLPLVQVALGAVVAYSLNLQLVLSPEIFFLLLLPPLLFLDGWRIPKNGLLRDKGTIIELALGLVVFTVLGMGFLIHWMIPSMPLPVAFALAAILSPTDPVAVAAIAKRVKIPHRLLHILEGESLLNDATGLVCMRFAVAAAMTGGFSLLDASLTFIAVAFGGLAIGVAFTMVATRAKLFVTRKFGEEPGSQILISVLIPFGAYLLAEHFHWSGILAAVAAGVTMSYAELRADTMAETNLRRTAVWDAIQLVANGVIFVLLGEQLPSIFQRALEIAQLHELLTYVLVVTAGLGAMRFVWVWVSFKFTLFRERRKGIAAGEQKGPSLRLIAAMSFAGVRGAITLAGVLTLPLVLRDGTPFPGRDMAVFIAAGVIVVSLVLATVLLPILLNGVEIPHDEDADQAEDAARVAAAKAGIKAVEAKQHALAESSDNADMIVEAAARVMAVYQHRVADCAHELGEGVSQKVITSTQRALLLVGIDAERGEIRRLGRAREIDEFLMRRLIREVDLTEERLVSQQ